MFQKQKSYYSLILFAIIANFGLKAHAQIYNSEIEGKIILETKDEFLNVTGTAKNKTEINQSLRYELSVIKNDGGNNNSRNAQSGRFVLGPNQIKELSKTSININTNSQIIVLLLIYDLEDNLLGKDRYVLNERKEQNRDEDVLEYTAKETAPEDGVTLKGIVTEETKTKAGNDFFNYFYASYMSNKINSDKIVSVEEYINFGRSTRIEIKVDNVLVFNFFVQPKDDFLRSMSEAAIIRVSRYLEQINRNKASITKY